MIVKFKDSKNSIPFYNIGINKIESNNTSYLENEQENIFSSQNLIENTTFEANNKRELLQFHITNSLNYQSQTNSFPSTLPEEINIKFTQLNLWERLNPFNSKEIAQTNIKDNTIYMSTEFLDKPKDLFLKKFSQKFADKQSVIDAIFYHEFAHIISTHHFPQISNIYSQLNHSKLQQSPLYQVIRNVEENFSDTYAALLHKEKHNAFDIYHYVASRNSTNSGKSKNFDFNINSLGKSFNQVNNVNLTSESIDDVCKKLYSISISSALEVLDKTISSNSEFKQKLINNLELLNQRNSDIFNSIESLLFQPVDNELIIPNKESIKNKMMNIRNHSSNQDNSAIKPTI